MSGMLLAQTTRRDEERQSAVGLGWIAALHLADGAGKTGVVFDVRERAGRGSSNAI